MERVAGSHTCVRSLPAAMWKVRCWNRSLRETRCCSSRSRLTYTWCLASAGASVDLQYLGEESWKVRIQSWKVRIRRNYAYAAVAWGFMRTLDQKGKQPYQRGKAQQGVSQIWLVHPPCRASAYLTLENKD